MKNLKKLYGFSIFFLCLGILTVPFGCQKEFELNEERSVDKKDAKSRLESRSCEAGNSTVTSGVLEFNSMADFIETMDFLSCTDSAGINSWRSSNGFQSAQEYFIEFSGKICCDTSITRDSIEQVVSHYQNHIKVIEEIDGSDTIYDFDTKYPVYTEFINTNGVFMIDGSIQGVTEDGYIISVADGNWTKYSNARSSMTEDTANGVFIHHIDDFYVESVPPTTCCDRNLKEVETVNKNRQEGYVNLRNISTSMPDPLNEGAFMTLPTYNYHSRVRSRTVKKFLGVTYFKCRRTKLDFSKEFNISHNVQGATSPWVENYGETTGTECDYNRRHTLIGFPISHHPSVVLVHIFCINSVDQDSPDINVSGLNAAISCN